jgi:soluble lytic murein transglycosylase
MWLSPDQQLGWERFKLLLSGGWFQEARIELASLPTPTQLEGQVVWAKLWALSFDYFKALEVMIKVWDSDSGFRDKDVIELNFQKEYSEFVDAGAKKYKLSNLLVYSLIRQESSFRAEVVSSAGARGLMQLLRSTGGEIAKDLRIRNFNADTDLFNPSINIKIGTNYLYRLVRNFGGNIPLALAAYNAGMGNIRGWLANRKDLSDLQSDRGKGPESDLWIEELPWSETRGYVKNILRNWIVYRLLDESEVSLSFPVWEDQGL